MLPWTDRAGRLSPLKIAAIIGGLTPLVLLIVSAFTGALAERPIESPIEGPAGLGPRPINAAILDTGQWAIRFLWLTLLVTPLRRILDWPQLVVVRRHLGVTALGYALLHFSLYCLDQQFRLGTIASEIVLRFYLTIGFIALLGLIALGSTSFDSMIKRLGAERWNRLHLLTHPIAFLAVFHFALQKKLDVSEPVVMAGLLVALWGARFLARWKIALTPLVLLGLTLFAGLATVLIEVAWYALGRGFPALPILMSNLDLELAPRPVHWVLGIGLLVVLVALIRSFLPKRQKGRGRQEGVARMRATPSPASPTSDPARS